MAPPLLLTDTLPPLLRLLLIVLARDVLVVEAFVDFDELVTWVDVPADVSVVLGR